MKGETLIMDMLCDLHTHSLFSDGSFTPAEIIDGAIEKKLSAVALTDHNTVGGLPDFLSYAEWKDIEAVAGAEFSVDYNGKELHLLGLFIPKEAFGTVEALMEEVNARKEKSNLELIESLSRSGYPLDYDALKNGVKGMVNRAVVARTMVEKGYVSSVKEAFGTLLAKDGGHYREPKRLTVWEILDFLKSIGAVSVLAHPFLNLTEGELLEFLPLACQRGLTGMECYYSEYDEKLTARSVEIARVFRLKESGGSDFHGASKPDIALGFGKGDLRVPYSCVEDLKR